MSFFVLMAAVAMLILLQPIVELSDTDPNLRRGKFAVAFVVRQRGQDQLLFSFVDGWL